MTNLLMVRHSSISPASLLSRLFGERVVLRIDHCRPLTDA
jgi:hypothetical protein